MMNKRFFRQVGFILFFGLCIAMLSKVTPASAAEEAKLNVSSVSVPMGETYRLRVYNLTEGQTVTYRSSDPSVALVTQAGRIYSASCGNAVITATVRDEEGVSATLRCEVLVGPAAVSIKLTKTSIVLKVGKSKLLRTVVYPLNTVEEAKFYSTDSDVAKVSAAGRVRAASEGVTYVYALLLNGTYDICEVTVLDDENYQKYIDGVSLEELLNLEDGSEGDGEVQDPSAGTGTESSASGSVPAEGAAHGNE